MLNISVQVGVYSTSVLMIPITILRKKNPIVNKFLINLFYTLHMQFWKTHFRTLCLSVLELLRLFREQTRSIASFKCSRIFLPQRLFGDMPNVATSIHLTTSIKRNLINCTVMSQYSPSLSTFLQLFMNFSIQQKFSNHTKKSFICTVARRMTQFLFQ